MLSHWKKGVSSYEQCPKVWSISILQSSSDDTSGNTGTMVPDNQTLVRNSGDNAQGGTDNGTMIQHRTLVPEMTPRTMTDLESDLGTMVINENDDDEDDDTMKSELDYNIHLLHTFDFWFETELNSVSGHDSKDYRPAFLDHFEKKERQDTSNSDTKSEKPSSGASAGAVVAQEVNASTSAVAANPALQRQLEQIAGGQPVGGHAVAAPSTYASSQEPSGEAAENNAAKFQKSLLDGDLEFVSW